MEQINEKTCCQCKELYEISPNGVWRFWCKLFKWYLKLNKNNKPIKPDDCPVD